MKAKPVIVTAMMLIVLLTSACAPSTAAQSAAQSLAQPPAPTIQLNLLPTPRPTATLEPTKATATATSQPIDRAATQRAFYRDQDQRAEATTAAASTGPDHFAGVWAGTMSFSDDPNRKEDIQVVIRQGCQVGKACGYLDNTTVQCKWEITVTSVKGQTLEYTFSKALSGDCPAGSSGKLTMQADGTLLREHKTPDFTASGQLIKQK